MVNGAPDRFWIIMLLFTWQLLLGAEEADRAVVAVGGGGVSVGGKGVSVVVGRGAAGKSAACTSEHLTV